MAGRWQKRWMASRSFLGPQRRFSVGVTAAVAVAHEAGIIHRDLKPANILLATNARGETVPKVSDFGLAKRLGIESTATMSGSIVGSPAYMSPEQASGHSKELDPASDVYALGAVLYECLTGRPPFRGTSIVDTLYQVRHNEPVRVRQLEPSVPVDLETIVTKCLRKEPGQRYATALALHDDLQRFLDGRPITARREHWHQTVWRLARRYPLVSSLAVLSLLLLLSIAVGSTVFAVHLRNALSRVTQAERTARLEKAVALLGDARGNRMIGKPGRRIQSLRTIKEAIAIGKELELPPAWFEPFRDEAIAEMWLSDIHVAEWRKTQAVLVSSDIAPDGHLVALAFDDGNIELRDRVSDKLIAQLAGEQRESFLTRFCRRSPVAVDEG